MFQVPVKVPTHDLFRRWRRLCLILWLSLSVGVTLFLLIQLYLEDPYYFMDMDQAFMFLLFSACAGGMAGFVIGMGTFWLTEHWHNRAFVWISLIVMSVLFSGIATTFFGLIFNRVGDWYDYTDQFVYYSLRFMLKVSSTIAVIIAVIMYVRFNRLIKERESANEREISVLS